MTRYYLILADLVAIAALVFGIYVPRHRRRDLVVAYLGINVGVLAVATSLSSATVGAGLGLGLFGVLALIRLRSAELDQHEIAYYFSALTLGLLGGLADAGGIAAPLMVLVLLAMYLGGHPRLMRNYRCQILLLDRAFTDEAALTVHLEGLLGAKVHQLTVQRIDLVNDTTTVEVRYELGARTAAPVPSGSG